MPLIFQAIRLNSLFSQINLKYISIFLVISERLSNFAENLEDFYIKIKAS
jgi:hypothetical protein